ncbi:MAG: restriction endonuclease subunit S [Candidatus Loosdrechtia sp.]|uniref:restriction endonuclease subunit S n=1 Tax=Candidatus Loosdrechtia sp. TaxID=3101272 RepID=UPI003A6BC4A3|nr:MAG: restriction endonuclease subunit S [Candidatus Jettenia sp. AMX2]
MGFKRWEHFKLDSLCQITSSKRIFAEEYVEYGTPFFRSKEIIQKALGESITEFLFISKERFSEIKKQFGAPQKGDVLLSSVGNRSGVPYLVKESDGDFYFKDGNLIWFKDFNPKLSCDYLYYWLKSSIGQNLLNSIMIGSAQKALTIIGLSGLEITLPSLSTQRRIASILSALDDKIELNHQTNQTLEAIAQAIYKEWFVNFNFPTSEGKPYRDSGGEMQDSELGPIPKRWMMSTLGNEGEFKNGINYSRDERGDALFSIVNVRDIVADKFLSKPSLDIIQIDRKKAQPYILKTDDILIVRSASPGETAILLIEEQDIIYSGFTIRYRLRNKKYFLYLFFILQNVKGALENLSNGTTLKNINQEMLKDYKINYPTEEIVASFNEIIEPIFEKIFINNQQNYNLEKVRDSLLPKLISGKIDM